MLKLVVDNTHAPPATLYTLDDRLAQQQARDNELIDALKVKAKILTHLAELFPDIAECTTSINHLDGFIVVLAAKGCWHGLQLKIKPKTANRPDLEPIEADWLARANQNGFAGCVVYNYTEALACIVDYWNGQEKTVKAYQYKGN